MASAVAYSAMADPLESSESILDQLTRGVDAYDTPQHSNVVNDANNAPTPPSAPSPYLPSLPSNSGTESGSDSSSRDGDNNRRRKEDDAASNLLLRGRGGDDNGDNGDNDNDNGSISSRSTRRLPRSSRQRKDGGSSSSVSSSRRNNSVRRKDVIRPIIIAASERRQQQQQQQQQQPKPIARESIARESFVVTRKEEEDAKEEEGTTTAGPLTPGNESERSPTSVAHVDHDDMKSSALLPPYSQHPLILLDTPLDTPKTPVEQQQQQQQQQQRQGGEEAVRQRRQHHRHHEESRNDGNNSDDDNNNNNNNNNNNENNNNDSTALVLHSSSKELHETDDGSHYRRGTPSSRPRGMDPSERTRDRTLLRDYDDEGPSDPPGESSNNGPVVCLDLVPHVVGGNAVNDDDDDDDSDSRGDGGGLGLRKWKQWKQLKQVKWVDSKSLNDEGEIDHSILRRYELMTSTPSSATHHHQYHHDNDGSHNAATATIATTTIATTTNNHVGIDPPSSHPSPSSTTLFRNPRMRIATVSSGYKKANFFVREDLDTRIYFHRLEDAVGYMARRGYVRMRSEEEREWKDLLGRAHGVVKVGPKKEKQRYRKGKLVLVLKKTIFDHKDETTSLRKKRKSSRRSSRKKSSSSSPLLLENGPSSSSSSSSSRTSRSDSSHTTAVTTSSSSHSAYSHSTANTKYTDRTSLGKSVRGEYESYSEKFLAEREEDKRRYMLAIVEGRPLPDDDCYRPSDTIGGRLLLTDGSSSPSPHGNNRNRGRRPVDPDEDCCPSSSRSRASASGGILTVYGSTTDDCSSGNDELKKSAHTIGSNRQGVYGGGVRYFTPDDNDDAPSEVSEEEDSTEDEDFEEEEETYDEENAYGERSEEEEEEGIDCDGSDLDSMFPEEEEGIDYKGNAGVESVTSETPSERRSSGRRGRGGGRGSSPKQVYKSSKSRRGATERFDAPEMVGISDDSASTNS